ncbi:MAG: hypothetical protein CVU77_00860 [Elusimicrobia bacterium HGW-Elusimicrobia-1]|jgi:4-amino-4-deoxy-L-arabinose transferase-like glycosyltransferase|nr:MAG: hypothetical protein CVU77_00860 [Elusimicrobia bacterium HGW-Elusimicrobia-1]
MDDKNNRYLLFALAAVLCFWGINFGLPQAVHADEQAFIKRALRFSTGDLNPHFFVYPTLYMYILFAAYGFYYIVNFAAGNFSAPSDFAAAYIRDPSHIYLIARGIGALCAVLSVYVAYLIGERLYGKKTALLGGLIFALNARFIEWSHYAKSDTAMLLAIMLFFLSCLKIREVGGKKYYILSGLFMGLAAAFKYNALMLYPAAIIAHFMPQPFSAITKPAARRHWLLALSAAFVVVGFTVGMPYWILDFGTFSRQVAQLVGFLSADTEFGRDLSALAYLKLLVYWGGNTPFLGLMVIAGALAVFLRREKSDVLPAAGAFIVFAGCSMQRIAQGQYLLPALPLFALIAARSFFVAVEKLKGNRLARYAFTAALSAALFHSAAVAALDDYALSQKDIRVLAAEWIEKNIPENTKMLVDTYGPRLARSRELLLRQYELASELGHHKKDYFKLQLDAQTGKEYRWYQIERPVVNIPEAREYSQIVELNVPLSLGVKQLSKAGFEYIILSPPMEPTAEEKKLDAELETVKEFSPARPVPPLRTRIKIYRLPVVRK